MQVGWSPTTALRLVTQYQLEEVLSLSGPKQRWVTSQLKFSWRREDWLLSSPATRKSTESRYDVEEIKQACMVINTADYCQTTSSEVRPFRDLVFSV